MIHVTLILEDTILVATEKYVPTNEDGTPTSPRGMFNVTCTDGYSGKTETATWSLEQLTAVLALGLGGVGEQNTPGYCPDVLYPVAESGIKGWCSEVRPIP